MAELGEVILAEGEEWALPGQVGMKMIDYLKRTYKGVVPPHTERQVADLSWSSWSPSGHIKVPCKECGALFTPKTRKHVYCSVCSDRRYIAKSKKDEDEYELGDGIHTVTCKTCGVIFTYEDGEISGRPRVHCAKCAKKQ